MDLAASHLGVTIKSVGAHELREILFELVPRKVSVDASAAGGDCRRVSRVLCVLEEGAVAAEGRRVPAGPRRRAGTAKKLQVALSDPRNFGMAKSLMMAGADAGFDMSSKQGVEVWTRSTQGKPLPSSIRLPSVGVATHRIGPQGHAREAKSAQGRAQGAQEEPVGLGRTSPEVAR